MLVRSHGRKNPPCTHCISRPKSPGLASVTSPRHCRASGGAQRASGGRPGARVSEPLLPTRGRGQEGWAEGGHAQEGGGGAAASGHRESRGACPRQLSPPTVRSALIPSKTQQCVPAPPSPVRSLTPPIGRCPTSSLRRRRRRRTSAARASGGGRYPPGAPGCSSRPYPRRFSCGCAPTRCTQEIDALSFSLRWDARRRTS